jgi:hypothetical protein
MLHQTFPSAKNSWSSSQGSRIYPRAKGLCSLWCTQTHSEKAVSPCLDLDRGVASKPLAEACATGRKPQKLLSLFYQLVIFGLCNPERR